MLQGHLPNGIVLGRMKDGQIQHTQGWDLTFSAPKSVSILVEIGNDERLRTAHDLAVNKALQWVEDHALGTRQRTSEGQLFERTGSMVVAKFTHHTSRNQDPMLHTHSVVMNATETGEGIWKSLHSMELFRNKMVAGQVYRSELAREALVLGYTLDVNQKDGTFELKEVPEHYRQMLSTRRAQVSAALAHWGRAGPEDAARAAILTRQSKQNTPHRELQQRWREAAAVRGIDVSEWRDAAEELGPSDIPEGLNLDEALRDARERVSEPEAVFAHGEILRHTLRLTLGRADVDQAEEALKLAAKGGQLIRADDGDVRRWTTPKARAQEQRAVEAVLHGTSRPILSERDAHAAALSRPRFTDGQRKATEFVLASPERYKAVLGRPGTGKTTMLAVVREHAEIKGVVVRGMAQNAAAARNLESEAGIRSSTIHKHLREVGPDIVRAKRGQNHWWTDLLKPRELWIVDEASQLPNALLSRLVWAAEAKGADVLFVGDNKQLAAIEAGRPFDLLLQKGIRHVEMDQILRQRNPEDLAAVRAAIRGDVRGALDNLGSRVQSIPDRQTRLQAMVKQWAQRPELRDDTILLTSRNQDRVALNEALRDVLRVEGRLGTETPRVNLEKVYGSRADSREIHHYAAGQLLQFPSGVKDKAIQDGEYLRVDAVDAERGLVTLKREESGERLHWHPREDAPRPAFPVVAYAERETTLAVGEKVRWLRNSRDLGLVNGDVLTVAAVDAEQTTFQRENGQTVMVPAAEPHGQHWTHAYASTVYRSQGQTAQRAIANLDSESGKLLSQKAFLVAISRHRDALSIYTDSREELEGLLKRETGEKTSAITEIERHDSSREALVRVDQLRQQRELEKQQQRLDHSRSMDRQ
jgi:conjugative relaxase-like TrwC/TraI family protein